MALTRSQQAAVDWQGNLVMFAGPGSGKTSTSIEKVMTILADPANKVLMTTFTREASSEMRQRLEKRFQDMGRAAPSEERLRISTFDSLTLWHMKIMTNGRMKLLSPQAQAPRIWQLCKELDIGKFENHAPWFDAYQAVIEREPLLEEIREKSPDSIQLIEAYYDWLRAGGMIDLATVKRTVAIQMRDGNMPLLPFTHMLVDEGQDCDELQIQIAITQGQNGCNTTLVGDDDQTIYDWRAAAGYKGMIKFRDECNAEVVRLAENFRSREEIVKHATQLIRFNNPDRIEKNQVAIKGAGGVVRLSSFASLVEQASWICGHIAENLKQPYSCAILSRTNINLDAAESACKEYGLPYHRQGSSLWDRDDIAAYTAMMTFWMSGGADMLSQTMGLLGFDRNTVNGMLMRLQTTQLAFRRGHVPDLPDVSSVERGVLEEMSRAFGKWRNEAKEAAEVYDPAAGADAYELIIRESINIFPNWYSSLGAVAKKNGEDHPKVTRMKSGLEHAEKALLKISGHLKSRIRLLRTKEKEECEEGQIRLLTMHGSKGLEWDDVYIIGADERDDDSTITAGPAERRVMFVGMTRARSKLNVTFSGKMPIFMKEAGFKNEDVQIEPPIVMTALAAEEEEGDGLIE